MFNLLAIFAVAMAGAVSSSKKERRSLKNRDYDKKIQKNFGYIVVIVALVLFAGLRINYNDTYTYWAAFVNESVTPKDVLANWTWTDNPAMELYKAIVRRFSTDKTALILLPSAFTEFSILRFLKKFSIQFDFSVFLFFTLGMFCFTMGAMKQSIAIGFLTYALESLNNKKYIKFFFFVFIAFLFHTYAVVLIIAPLLLRKPWSAFTWFMAIGAVIIFMNLESILGSIIDAAETTGKKIYEDEILGGAGSNIFRILVYAVPPVISLIFRKKLFEDSQPIENLMVHMSILSFACMAYGLAVNANEADRLATYFEIGTLVSLPWMLKKAFDEETHKVIKYCAYAAYFIFFVYKFYFCENFDADYQSILIRYL